MHLFSRNEREGRRVFGIDPYLLLIVQWLITEENLRNHTFTEFSWRLCLMPDRHSFKKIFLLPCAAILLSCLFAAPYATAFPEPAMSSPSWVLDFEYKMPEAISIRDVEGRLRWFWFMPYKVANNTGEDRLFIPEITIADDQGSIVTAGQGIPVSVFPAIQSHLNNPLLESPIEVIGKIMQGEDYARESVAIWPVAEGDVDEMTVFVSGISGETTMIESPSTGEQILMRRTLMIRFATPGSPTGETLSPQKQPIVLVDEQYVMR